MCHFWLVSTSHLYWQAKDLYTWALWRVCDYLLEHLTKLPQKKENVAEGTAERWMLWKADELHNIQAVVYPFFLASHLSLGLWRELKNKLTTFPQTFSLHISYCTKCALLQEYSAFYCFIVIYHFKLSRTGFFLRNIYSGYFDK